MSSPLISLYPSCPTPDKTGRHRCAVYPSSSVSDAQWTILEPLLPSIGNTQGHGGRPEKHCRRVILDSIFYLVRGGIAWRQLPSEFPPPTTVWAIFARSVRAGVWQRIHDALRDRARVRDGRNPLPTAAIIDSQSVQGSDTVPRSSRGYDAGKKTNGLLLAGVVTMAGIQDRDGAVRLLTALRAHFSTIDLV